VDVRETHRQHDAGSPSRSVPRGRHGRDQGGARRDAQTFAPRGRRCNTLPAVLLVNNGTSGAAEIFAAALAGRKRAVLVGERTHGRTAVQKSVRLPDGAVMIVSNGWYLTPAGDPIHEKGIVPEVLVGVPEIDFGAPPPTRRHSPEGAEKLR
jgi:C-terminal processing protease CtpA/Prc